MRRSPASLSSSTSGEASDIGRSPTHIRHKIRENASLPRRATLLSAQTSAIIFIDGHSKLCQADSTFFCFRETIQNHSALFNRKRKKATPFRLIDERTVHASSNRNRLFHRP